MSEPIDHGAVRKLAEHCNCGADRCSQADMTGILKHLHECTLARAYLALTRDRDAIHATLGDAGMAAMHAEKRVAEIEAEVARLVADRNSIRAQLHDHHRVSTDTIAKLVGERDHYFRRTIAIEKYDRDTGVDAWKARAERYEKDLREALTLIRCRSELLVHDIADWLEKRLLGEGASLRDDSAPDKEPTP